MISISNNMIIKGIITIAKHKYSSNCIGMRDSKKKEKRKIRSKKNDSLTWHCRLTYHRSIPTFPICSAQLYFYIKTET